MIQKFNKYDDKSGLEDAKLSKLDYEILYELYVNTKESEYKLYILLLFMFSYYKLDGITFKPKYFPTKHFANFIKKFLLSVQN